MFVLPMYLFNAHALQLFAWVFSSLFLHVTIHKILKKKNNHPVAGYPAREGEVNAKDE